MSDAPGGVSGLTPERVTDAWLERIVSGHYGGASWAEIHNACLDLLDARKRLRVMEDALREILDALEALEAWDDALGSRSISQAVGAARDRLRGVTE